MNKTVMFLLSACILFSLTGCSRSASAIPTPESPTEQTQMPTYQEDIQWIWVDDPVLNTYASSTYSGDLATHDATNLLDGDLTTNWTENAPGDGIGEYVEFQFKGAYLLQAIYIHAGNHYDEERYLNNSRPERITVEFSDGSAWQFILKDIMEGQVILLEEPVVTQNVRITIDSVYHGAKYTDTVISEVDFDVYVPSVG